MIMIILILILILYSCIYLGLLFLEKIYNPIKKIRIKKIDKIKYYGDELDEYSPLINAKILGKDIFDQDVVVSMLLYLNEKESNYNISELKSHEKEFLEKKDFIFYDLKNHESTLYINNTTLKRHIEDLIENDMKELLLLEDKYRENIGYIRKTDILTFLLFMINFFCISFLGNYITLYTQNIFSALCVFEIIVNLMWIIIYTINISLNLTLKMNLTEKGKIYYEKLNASRNFLKEYSLISKRTIIEEKLWGSFIRNAIFFNLKGKLDDDAKKYYKQVIDKYKYKEFIKLKINKLITIIPIVILISPWFALLLIGNTLFGLILSNIIINPIIFMYFIRKNNPTAVG